MMLEGSDSSQAVFHVSRHPITRCPDVDMGRSQDARRSLDQGIRPLSTEFDSPGRRSMSRCAGHFLFLDQLRAVVVPDDIDIVA